MRVIGLLLLIGAVLSSTGCSSIVTANSEIDKRIDDALESFCPMKKAGAEPSEENRILRAYLVLSAITDEAAINIGAYSGSSSKSDATAVSAKIKYAADVIHEIKKNHLFYVYRADAIVALADAATAAVDPAIHAGKSNIVSFGSGRIDFIKNVLLSTLTTSIYVDAYQKACAKNTLPQKSEIIDRIKKRCGALKNDFNITDASSECTQVDE